MGEFTAFGYLNHAVVGTVTATSEEASLPATNLALPQCDEASSWQSLDTVTDATLTVTLADAGTIVRGVGAFRTNLTADAVVTVSAYLTAGPTLVDQLVLSGPQTRFLQVVGIFATNVTCDYLTIRINDPTNPDGHIRIGGLFVGPLWFPLIGVTWQTTLGAEDNVKQRLTRGGQSFRTLLSRRRVLRPVFEALHSSEVWDALDEMDCVGAGGQNVLAILDVTGVDLYREAVFGELLDKTDIGFSASNIDVRSYRATIKERI